MYINGNNNLEKKYSSNSYMVLIILFLIGFLNGKPYFDFMGFSILPQFLMLFVFIITILYSLIIFLDILFKRKSHIFSSNYWIILFLALFIKYFLLFVQFPGSFMPGGDNLYPMISMFINIFVIFILVESIKNMEALRLSIWSLGLGALLSTVIPILLFPEYIGLRINEIDGFNISGGFWNQSVISYMSIGWLLIFLSAYENNRLYKILSFLTFLIIITGGLFGLSRALLLSIIISTFTYLTVSNKLRKYVRSIVVIIIVIGIASFLFSDVIEGLSNRIDGGVQIEEEVRVDIWRDYIKNIPNYFLFGEIEGNYKKYSSSPKEFGPHSVFLNWFVQFGILGLIGFMYLIYGVYRSYKNILRLQNREYAAIVLAWLVAYLSIAGINETGFSQLSIYTGFGLILAWGNIAKNDKKVLKA